MLTRDILDHTTQHLVAKPQAPMAFPMRSSNTYPHRYTQSSTPSLPVWPLTHTHPQNGANALHDSYIKKVTHRLYTITYPSPF
jgi:hypothetical protein